MLIAFEWLDRVWGSPSCYLPRVAADDRVPTHAVQRNLPARCLFAPAAMTGTTVNQGLRNLPRLIGRTRPTAVHWIFMCAT